MKLVFTIKKYRTSIILFLVFETIAVWLWQATGKLFFLLNFSYIGIWVALGLLLFHRRLEVCQRIYSVWCRLLYARVSRSDMP